MAQGIHLYTATSWHREQKLCAIMSSDKRTNEAMFTYAPTDNQTIEAALQQHPVTYIRIPSDTETTVGENKYLILSDSVAAVDSNLQTSSEDKGEKGPKQNSVITVFTIWNTMMGTSILAIPWALAQAGFGFGIFLIFLVAGIATYTAYLAERTTEDLRTIKNLPKDIFLDFTDAVHYHFGRPGRIISSVFSQVVILGASIVYYVLLSNFLYNTGKYIYQSATNEFPIPPTISFGGRNFTDILCDVEGINGTYIETTTNELFGKLWHVQHTVPVWLLLILFPLVSIKSPTFLGKFTALATISVIYLFILTGIKGYSWKVNMSADKVTGTIENYRDLFASLTGACSMAFFIHNALHTILRAQRTPKHNPQVILAAFGITTLTYSLIGCIFFAVFPVSKRCIKDNLLDSLVTDVPVFVGRLALLFQMSTVYPMIVYILRAQFMYAVFGKIYPSWKHVLIFHLVVVGLGVLFAVVYPQIGTIIRFIGATGGFIFIFTLPPLITLLNKRILWREVAVHPNIEFGAVSDYAKNDKASPKISDELTVLHDWCDKKTCILWWIRCFFYMLIMLFGLLNFIAQFVLLGIPQNSSVPG
ncbi:hypothetical protein CRM22_010368 [Opisthorchis felineus]|uniref:Amino acid transporter transmembrane domain-containing protein n=1 Tax=Opisthorchis felineus TaxID=147828 RepID=A0A4S2L4Y1_OPIFE|nr:hypothetical protein CRM22_010368 [Opisthorchis felineus]